jgi:hypothetical protein
MSAPDGEETAAARGGAREALKKWGMLAVGAIGLLALFIGGGLFLAMPRHHHDTRQPAAIGALRTISTAQTIFREGDKDGDGVLDFATTLEALAAPGVDLIDGVLASGRKQGYLFTMNEVPVDATGFEWNCRASPEKIIYGYERYFFIDHSGLIRYNETGPAGPADPPIGR